MRPLSRDHGPDLCRIVQDVSAGFITPDPITESLTNVMANRVCVQSQTFAAFDFSSAILDWQRSATRSRSRRARAVSHSKSSAEASYWSL